MDRPSASTEMAKGRSKRDGSWGFEAVKRERDTAPASVENVKGYEAWFERYGLSLKEPAMLGADPDGDGYANRDEFLFDTDPTKADSHPGFHPVIRLREFQAVEEPWVLEKVDGRKARMRNPGTGETSTVTEGEMLGDVKIKRVTPQMGSDKFGQTNDVSRVTGEKTSTGETVSFVTGMPTRSSSSHAVLTSSQDNTLSIKVVQGMEFAWPGDPEKKFRIVDLRPDQAVAKDLDTGEIWTIPMESAKP